MTQVDFVSLQSDASTEGLLFEAWFFQMMEEEVEKGSRLLSWFSPPPANSIRSGIYLTEKLRAILRVSTLLWEDYLTKRAVVERLQPCDQQVAPNRECATALSRYFYAWENFQSGVRVLLLDKCPAAVSFCRIGFGEDGQLWYGGQYRHGPSSFPTVRQLSL
jgi:hypothetical protein